MTNYRVSVTPHNPVNSTVTEIAECGYIWPVGTATERIVSSEDLETLKLESSRMQNNELLKIRKKTARFVLHVVGPTDEPVDNRKVKTFSALKETLPPTREELMKEQNSLLLEQNKALNGTLAAISDTLSAIKTSIGKQK